MHTKFVFTLSTLTMIIFGASLVAVFPNEQFGAGREKEFGIRFDLTTAAPKLTRAQAIQVAKDWLGPVQSALATQIATQHVLFSDHQYRVPVDEQGLPRTDTPPEQRIYLNQRVPVWIVTFDGLSLPARGGSTQPAFHQAHIVINAEIGEYMEMFAYQ